MFKSLVCLFMPCNWELITNIYVYVGADLKSGPVKRGLWQCSRCRQLSLGRAGMDRYELTQKERRRRNDDPN